MSPRVCAYLMALCIGAAVAHSVYAVPIQPTDTIEAFTIGSAAASTVSLIASASRVSDATLRPSRFVQTRWLLQLADAASLSYHVVFRGLHAATVLALLLLFVHVLQVRTWEDLAAASIPITIVVGLHTFTPLLTEAYPVNHFLEVALAALAVVALGQRSPGWLTICAIALMLTLGVPLVESGVLIWVAVIACGVAGMPGIDRRTILVTTAMVAVYIGTRQALHIQMPEIGGHGSGFGGRFYEGPELVARFGSGSMMFSAYNVAASALSVLFSEPRSGVFVTFAGAGSWRPVTLINIASSFLATIAIVWYAIRRLARARARWTVRDKVFVVAVMMIPANAAFSLSYVKDEMLSVAGVFYALAAYVAAGALLTEVRHSGRARVLAFSTLIMIAGSLWAFRAAGVHFQLRTAAFKTRNDWASMDTAKRGGQSDDASVTMLIERIRRDALRRPTTSPSFLPRWGEEYWVE